MTDQITSPAKGLVISALNPIGQRLKLREPMRHFSARPMPVLWISAQ